MVRGAANIGEAFSPLDARVASKVLRLTRSKQDSMTCLFNPAIWLPEFDSWEFDSVLD